MSYIINKTDGSALITILDGTTNNQTGITLIGRNYTTYGELQNENFVRLLENFADTIPPGQSVGFSPIEGTLWWNTNLDPTVGLIGPRLYVYNGTNWIPTSERTVGTSAPTDYKTGDQWWDTVNQQLKVYAGSAWTVIGPTSSAAQGKSGVYIESILAADTNAYQVICTYSAGTLLSIQSSVSFTVAPSSPYIELGFSSIVPGINIPTTSVFNGTANNAITAGGVDPSKFARNDINTTFTNDVTINGRMTFGSSANVYMSGTELAVQNKLFNGNVLFQVNGTSGQLTPLKIEAATGTLVAPAAPTLPTHITNKLYVDGIQAFLQNELDNVNNQLQADVQQVFNDYVANLNTVVSSTNSNLNQVNTTINSNISNVNANVTNGFTAANASIASVADRITSIEHFLPNVALYNSPGFYGTPTAPNPQAYYNYVTSLGSAALPYAMYLSLGLSGVTNGWTITQYRKDNDTLIATFLITQVGDGITQPFIVTLTSGAISQNVANYIKLGSSSSNQTLVTPETSVTSISQLGPSLTYTGVGDNSSRLSTTAYVDATANKVFVDYTQKITTANSAAVAYMTGLLTPKAPLASPAFTGNPTAPTPSGTDNSTSIATTAFVQAAVATGKLSYTVSSSPPSAGNDGDFWFQIG